jgi:hypothetical protein
MQALDFYQFFAARECSKLLEGPRNGALGNIGIKMPTKLSTEMVDARGA